VQVFCPLTDKTNEIALVVSKLPPEVVRAKGMDAGNTSCVFMSEKQTRQPMGYLNDNQSVFKGLHSTEYLSYSDKLAEVTKWLDDIGRKLRDEGLAKDEAVCGQRQFGG
jgi:hypothetical protein